MSYPGNPVSVLIGKGFQKQGGPPKGTTGPNAPQRVTPQRVTPQRVAPQTGAPKQGTPPPVTLRVRTATLNLKAQWNVGETFDPKTAVTVSEGTFVTEIIEPKQAKFAKSGDAIAVRIKVTGQGVYQDCEAAGTVKVIKNPTSIAWRKPQPVLVNTRLGPNQQYARIDPATLTHRLVYTPAPNTKLQAVKTETLAVAFGPDEAYDDASATVDLTVVADITDLAAVTGSEDMLTGRAWNGPSTTAGQDLLDAWYLDTDGLRTQGQKIMTDLKGKTAEELIEYMNGKVKNKDTDVLDQTLNSHGGLAKYPNKIWKFSNGLQVRYKENGDDHNPGVPMFCVEGQTNKDGFSRQAYDDVAFKVMENKDPGCPGQPVSPNWVFNHPENTIRDTYNRSACALTHLKCEPKKDQYIEWAQPEAIFTDTKLSARQLSAKAKSLADPTYEADCTYEDDSGNAVAEKGRLPFGDQTVFAIAAKTARYNEQRKSVVIPVKRYPQTITWAQPPDIEIGDKMNAGKTKRLNATAKTKVTYKDQNGRAVTENTTFGMTGQVTITAYAEAFGNFDAAPPVPYTIAVTNPKPVQKNPPQPKKGRGKK